jgi:hypothetical protein
MSGIILYQTGKRCDSQIINDDVIACLINTFGDVESYVNHLNVLWELRELIIRRIGENEPTKSELFPAFHTINSIIGVLGHSDKGFKAFIKSNPNI